MQKTDNTIAHKTRKNRRSERGNVFFTLFGAVAVVGVLGAGIMATMRGPLSTMVEVQHRAQADAEMSIAGKLVLLEASEQADNGDCDSDNYVEPLEYLDSAPQPTGGGQLPATVGSNKEDPWGTDYGYCAWDAGDTNEVGCGGASQNRLTGGDQSKIVIAVMSAGADKTFQTTCSAGTSPTATKTAGSDDIIKTFTYLEAVSATAGLWSIKADAPAVATIDKEIEVTGDIDLKLDGGAGTGRLLLGAGSMLLPTDTDLGTCNSANDLLLRVNTTLSPPAVQICDWDGTTGTWELASGDTTLWSVDGSDIYFEANVGIGSGMTDPQFTLDVAGTLNTTGATTLGAALSVGDDITMANTKSVVWASGASITEASGALQINANGGAGVELDVDAGDITMIADVDITGSTSDNSAAALNVKDSAAASLIYVRNDGNVGIGTDTPAQELDVSGTGVFSSRLGVNTSSPNDLFEVKNTTNVSFPQYMRSNGRKLYLIGNTEPYSRFELGSGVISASHTGLTFNASTGNTTIANAGVGIGPSATRTLSLYTSNATALTERLRIDTTDINAYLDLTGSGSITAGSAITAGGTVTAGVTTHGDNAFIIDDGSTAVIFGPAAQCSSSQKLSWSDTAGWSCATDIGSGSGSGGGQTLADTLAEGDDAGGDDAEGFGKIGAAEFCEADNTGCVNADDLRDANKIDGENIKSTISADTTTTGQVLSWDQGNSYWEATTLAALGVNDLARDTTIDATTCTSGQTAISNGAGDWICGDVGDLGGTPNSIAINDLTDAAKDATNNNLFLGHTGGAAGDNNDANTAVGIDALISLNNSATAGDGDFNVAFGSFALQNNTTGNNNTALGYSSLKSSTTSSLNTAIGSNAGLSLTEGVGNVFIGANAARFTTTGITNVAIGSFAGQSNTSGSRNVFVGRSAGFNNTIEGSNVFVGHFAGRHATADNNIFIGYQSGQAASGAELTGTDNTFVGYQTGLVNTSGNANTFIGDSAGLSNSIGARNTFIGNLAGQTNTEGGNNTVLGYDSFSANTTGASNTALGRSALSSNIDGVNNTAVGREALSANTTAGGNTAVGMYAQQSGITGSGNATLGLGSLQFNTTGLNNTAVGALAGKGVSASSNLSNNALFGYQAGFALLTGGDDNTLLGYQAGDAITTGAKNIVIGSNIDTDAPATDEYLNIGNALFGTMGDTTSTSDEGADLTVDGNLTVSDLTITGTLIGGATSLDDLTDATNDAADNNLFLGHTGGAAGDNNDFNTAVGIGALVSLNDDAATNAGDRNTAIGADALKSNTTGSFNVAIGYEALVVNTTGVANTAVGDRAGFDLISGNTNTALGQSALRKTTTASGNVAIGSRALYTNVTQGANVAIGADAMRYADSSSTAANSFNTAVGYQALRGSATAANNTGVQNTAVGGAALQANTSGASNVALGYSALIVNTTGLANTAVGKQAMSANTTGGANVASGFRALFLNTTGSSNAVYGADALFYNNTGANNAVFGYRAGFGANGGGASDVSNNALFGFRSGLALLTGGDDNTLLGYQAGDAITTGAKNIVIGSGIDTDAPTTNEYLNIGNALFGEMGNTASTTDGGADLTIDGDLNVTGAISGSFSVDKITEGDTVVEVVDAGDGYITLTEDGTEYMRLTGGNVGIGTDEPTAKLHVIVADAGASSPLGKFVVAGASGNQVVLGANTTYSWIQSHGSVPLAINPVGSSVGIGDTSPDGTLKLDVEGQIGATEYCDENGANCVAAASLGAPTIAIDDLSDAAKDTTNNNLFLGHTGGAAGNNNDFNTAVGIGALDALNDDATANYGDWNTALGDRALTDNTTGYHNVAVGSRALQSNITGNNNTSLGNQSLFNNTTGNSNVGIGIYALLGNQSGNNNVAMGRSALGTGTSLSSNVAVGYLAGYYNTANANTLIGYQSGQAASGAELTGTDNTFVGYQTGLVNTSGYSNTFIGDSAGRANTTGYENIGLGPSTLLVNTEGIRNTAIGNWALRLNTIGNRNTATGPFTLGDNTTGNFNTANGFGALRYNEIGSYNAALGMQAGHGVDGGSDISKNTLLGFQSGYVLLTGGDNNTLIGYEAGDAITTGAKNIVIGSGIDTDAPTTNEYLNIGNALFGDMGNTASTTDGGADLTIDGDLNVTGAISGSFSVDKITEGDTVVEVVDAGDGYITLTEDGTEYMRLTGGNVGIGTTAPSVNLEVVDAGTAQMMLYNSTAPSIMETHAELIFKGKITSGTAYEAAKISAAHDSSANSRRSALIFETAGNTPGVLSEKMRISSAGNVGIGTDAPSSLLHLYGASPVLTIQPSASSQTSSIQLYRTTGAGAQVASGTLASTGSGVRLSTTSSGSAPLMEFVTANGISGSHIDFKPKGVAAVRIQDTGTVGIGDTTPDGTLLLDVEGQIGATEYCDENGANCVAAASLGAPTIAIDDLSDAVKDTTNNNLFLGHDGGAAGDSNDNNTAVGLNTLVGLNNDVSANSGDNNTGIGYSVLKANTTGYRNVAVGVFAMESNTTGRDNIAAGFNALKDNIDGLHNAAVGSYALQNNISGSYNFAGGTFTLNANTTGNNNIAHGYTALGDNIDGLHNTSYGGYSLQRNTGGNYNNATGGYALNTNTTGSFNNAFGYAALAGNKSGVRNIAIGSYAGRYLVDGSTLNETTDNSVYVGYNTKASADGVTNENVFGYSATGIGSNTVTLGNDSIVTTALKGNVGIGTTAPSTSLHIHKGPANQSLKKAIIIDWNTSTARTNFIGIKDADELIIGADESALGSSSNIQFRVDANEKMRLTSDGYLGLGTTAPSSLIDLEDTGTAKVNTDILEITNTVNAADMDGTESSVVFNQYYYDATTPAVAEAARITAGTETDWTSTASTQDSYLAFTTVDGGTAAEAMRITSAGNVGIGDTSPDATLKLDVEGQIGATEYCDENGANCVAAASLGAPTIAIDDLSDAVKDTTNNNLFLGHDGGAAGDSNDKNTAVGIGALISLNNSATNNHGDKNTALGYFALNANTTGFFNTALGDNALKSNTTGNNNTGVGKSVLSANSTGASNSALGIYALLQNTTGGNNVAFGRSALSSNLTGSANVAIGYHSGFYATASQNTFIGTESGKAASGSELTGTYNTFVGYQTGLVNTSGYSNTFIGDSVGKANTTGHFNAALGTNALVANTTGNSNVAIGLSALSANTTGNTNTVSGESAFRHNNTGSGNTVYGYRAGFGVSAASNTTGNALFGSQAGYGLLTGGNNNTLLGIGAGYNITTGAKNIVIGSNIDTDAPATDEYLNIGNALFGEMGNTASTTDGGASLTIDGSLTVSGTCTGCGGASDINSLSDAAYDTATDFNLFIGHEGGASLPAGAQYNTATGIGALDSINNALADFNTAYGYEALTANTEGSANTASGYQALRFNTTGLQNTASGSFALSSNTAGSANTASGYYALFSNTAGSANTASGYQALRFNTTGLRNTASGSFALSSNTTGSQNTASGYYALLSNTTGLRNTASGSHALFSNTTGLNNTASGYYALYSNNINNGSTAFGYEANRYADNRTVSALDAYNTSIGYQALRGSTTAANNTGTLNTALGAQSLLAYTSGGSNVAVGYQAGDNLTTASRNILIGASGVDSDNTDDYLNIGNAFYGDMGTSTGTGTGDAALTVDGGLSVVDLTVSGTCTGCGGGGASALDDLTDAANDTTNNNIFLGHDGGSAGANNDYNTAVGVNALDALNNDATAFKGDENTAVGYEALGDNTTGSNNTAMGTYALSKNASDRNVAYGSGALRYNTSGNSNAALGTHALRSNTTGIQNTAIGDSSLQNNNGNSNTAVGRASLAANTTGGSNVGIGAGALNKNTTGGDNVAVGVEALFNNVGGINNVAIGHRALNNGTSGSNNVILGRRTAESLTTANRNIILGYEATDSDNTDDYLNIGNAFYGDMGTSTGTGTGDAALTVDGGLTIAHVSDTDVLILSDSDGTCNHNPESGAETVSCSSDIRLKKDIVDAAPVLDYWDGFVIKDYTVRASGTKMTGVIAQELREVHPELVTEGGDGFLQVEQPNPWKLVKAVQELRTALDDLRAENAVLRSGASSPHTPSTPLVAAPADGNGAVFTMNDIIKLMVIGFLMMGIMVIFAFIMGRRSHA